MTPDTVTRRVPFWILFAGSLALTGYGVWAAVSRVTRLETVLTSNAATTADVYGGQAWVVLESGLAVAGIVGLITTFAVWALAARTPTMRTGDATPSVAVVEHADTTDTTPAAPSLPDTEATSLPATPTGADTGSSGEAVDTDTEAVPVGPRITRH